MIKLKKIIAVAMAALTMGAAFASGTEDSGAAANGKVVLDVLNYVDSSEDTSVQMWEEIRAAFEAKYPNIELKIENLFNEPYHQKLAARTAAGNMPDVFYMWPTERSGKIIRSGLVEELSPYVDKSLYAPAATAPQVDGKMWVLPMTLTACHVMYTNTKVLKDNGLEVPKTYADMVAMVPVLKEKGLQTVFMANKSDWVMNSTMFGALIAKTGGVKWMSEAVAGEHKFTDKAFVDALKMVENLYKDGVVSDTTLQMDYGTGPNEFAAGNAPFLVDGDWQTGAIENLLTPEQIEDIEYMVLPTIPGEVTGDVTAMVQGTGMSMAAGLEGDKKEAALAFVKFFAGPEAAKIRARIQGIPPAYIIDSAELEISPLSKKRFAFYATVAGADVVDAVLPQDANRVLNVGMQEIGLGVKTAEEVAEEVEAAMNR